MEIRISSAFSLPFLSSVARARQDVRAPADFEAYHIPGSTNVPLFIPIEGTSVDKLMKKFVYAMNGMAGAAGPGKRGRGSSADRRSAERKGAGNGSGCDPGSSRV